MSTETVTTTQNMGPELAAALVKLQGEVEPIKPNALNTFLDHKYADLPQIIKEVKPKLKDNGLAVVQLPSHIEGQSALSTMVLHQSGQYIEATMPILLPSKHTEMKWDKKASKEVEKLVEATTQDQGGAITYLRRYAYLSALGLVVDEEARVDSSDSRGSMGLKNGGKPTGSNERPVTDAQKTLITNLAQGMGFPEEHIKARIDEMKGSKDASIAITDLKNLKNKGYRYEEAQS